MGELNRNMIEWIADPKFKNELEEICFIMPSDWKVWTIRCPEMHYDQEKETTFLILKSKNYYFRVKKDL